MTEERTHYCTENPLQTPNKPATMDTGLDMVREHLADMERQLISMLVTVQRAQGKEPTVLTRAERRGR